MKRRIKAQNKQAKKILTVGELKTWLDGYCSAHDDSWTPTADQWNLIKEKIFSLDDGKIATPSPVYAAPVPRQQVHSPQPAPSYSGAGATLPPPPSVLSVDDGAPSVSQKGMVGVTDKPATIIRDGKLITPSKDTPGGPSDFA